MINLIKSGISPIELYNTAGSAQTLLLFSDL